MREDFLWSEKYRPSNISDFIFHTDSQKKQISDYLNRGEIPHLLFSGSAGCGKTTLSKIIVNELDIDPFDIKVINASDENSVDDMRTKIKIFAEGFPMGDFKIIQLEECDMLSRQSQGVLRHIMEEHADTCRFIGTCNYVNKVIEPLRSRFQEISFKSPDMDSTLLYMSEILFSEDVEFDVDLLGKYVKSCYPDIRKTINVLQQNSVDGVLIESNVEAVSSYKLKMLNLLERNEFTLLRTLICAEVTNEEIEEVYTFLYNNLQSSPNFKDIDNYESGLVLIAKYLYRHSSFAVPEINLAALFIELGLIK